MTSLRSVHTVRLKLYFFTATGLHYNKWSHPHSMAVAKAVAVVLDKLMFKFIFVRLWQWNCVKVM